MSQKNTHNKDITRKQALKKMGTYAAFAALGTMVILNPAKAQSNSDISNPGFGGGNGVRGTRRNKNKK